jgi:hypothetical protein
MDLDQAIGEAWTVAADDLGIEVEIGGTLRDESQRPRRYTVRVAHFGRPNGTICVDEVNDDRRTLHQLARDGGYGFSVLHEPYATYDRDLFIDTLNDWQWCGEGQPPSWYTGEPWTA